MDKDLYTPKEAAERLGVNKAHIYNLIKTGTLKASNIGTGKRAVLRISSEDISKYLQGCKQISVESTITPNDATT